MCVKLTPDTIGPNQLRPNPVPNPHHLVTQTKFKPNEPKELRHWRLLGYLTLVCPTFRLPVRSTSLKYCWRPRVALEQCCAHPPRHHRFNDDQNLCRKPPEMLSSLEYAFFTRVCWFLLELHLKVGRILDFPLDFKPQRQISSSK